MKGNANHYRWLSIALPLLAAVSVSLAGPRDDLWKQVNDAFAKGLPRTAIGVMDEIIPLALEDQA